MSKDEISRQMEEAAKKAAAKKQGRAGRSGKAQRSKRAQRFPFKVEQGYVWREVEESTEDGGTRKKWVAFISEVHIRAATRSPESEDWGLLLEVVDPDGAAHEWPMPQALLAGSGEALKGELLRLGMRPALGNRKWKEWLTEYLVCASPEDRARCVGSIGWHGGSFVLPDEVFSGEKVSERVVLQSAGRLDHAFHQKGTIEGWRSEVAEPSIGNSRLVLAISAAFAAPLLSITGDESGGFHFRGGSSLGKSTALDVAGSVWGGGGAALGYKKTWRATDNALEGVAAMHNGAILCLDELSQIDAKAAGEAIYMLGNGKGKGRQTKEGTLKREQTWHTLFLSNGEVSLADKLQEAGKRVAAGMDVRLIDLRADAGAGLGLFDKVPNGVTPAEFSQRLKAASAQHYGTAARAFLREIVDDLQRVVESVADMRRDFLAMAVPENADGQVRRVADRFALVAVAGDIASELGLTGWPSGEARTAALRCFRDWVAERGGVGAGEVSIARKRIAEAIETYGQARFQDWNNRDRAIVTPRWGFVKGWEEDEDSEAVGRWRKLEFEWFFTSSGLKSVLSGLDFRSVIAGLVAQGVIIGHGEKRSPSKTFRVPNAGGNVRLYQVNASALGDDLEASEGGQE
jgi:putative DNA primase/helicase